MFNQNSCTQVKNPTGELGKQGKHGSHASSVTIYAFGLEKISHRCSCVIITVESVNDPFISKTENRITEIGRAHV